MHEASASQSSGVVPADEPALAGPAAEQWVVIGQVSGLFGTRGWIKVFSHTRPRSNIVSYAPWYLRGAEGWSRFAVEEARAHHGGVVARLGGIEDRDQAAVLVRRAIAVHRSQLAALAGDEYYWSDLIGMQVENLAGDALGQVRALFENGAHDVLEVVGSTTRLIPFVRGVYVIDIDRGGRRIRVDWHLED